ncbi:ribosomal protein L31, mitochondrial [Pseudohyphozyma bogoriensis]|nr:ribosomal protein L31, mitochondrial [Pseudohyphozyma bogoriensis]
MFGFFRPSPISQVGLLWKTPWRMSKSRKLRARLRLKNVDDVIATVESSGVEVAALTRALELPTEAEMRAKDKYTIFSRTDRNYRKGMHKVPKWTKLTSRENPAGF